MKRVSPKCSHIHDSKKSDRIIVQLLNIRCELTQSYHAHKTKTISVYFEWLNPYAVLKMYNFIDPPCAAKQFKKQPDIKSRRYHWMTNPQSDCFKHGCHARFNVALITCQRYATCRTCTNMKYRRWQAGDLHTKICHSSERISSSNVTLWLGNNTLL